MKTVVVLGCHRSATSLVAKGLHEAGVYMGDDLLGSGRGNPDGHYEDREFVRHNDQILTTAGGSWDRPPSVEAITRAAVAHYESTADLIRRKQARGVLWGWKDPRTVLTWPAYRDLLVDPVLIIVRRDVDRIAASLHARDGRPLEQCCALATEYIHRLRLIEER